MRAGVPGSSIGMHGNNKSVAEIRTALEYGISRIIVDSFEEQTSGIRYTVPWSTLGVIVGLAYFASLLTTFLPASQASRVYPAEALRYE